MKKIILLAVMLLVAVILFTGCSESTKRVFKDYQSEWNGGLNRTVSVYSYDGKPIQSWSGKFDVYDAEDGVYFDINGKRIGIYGGIVINEEH